MKQRRKLLAVSLAVMLILCQSVLAFAQAKLSTWTPDPEEVFQNSGIVIYDKTTTAVSCGAKIIPSPGTLSFSMADVEYWDEGGKVIARMSWNSHQAIINKYYMTAYNDDGSGLTYQAPPNGYADWSMLLCDLLNDWRKVPRADYGTFKTANCTVESCAQDVVRYTNQQRTSAGLPALVQDEKLSELAMKRAKELATDMSHTRPNGQQSTAWVKSSTSFAGTSENIASGQDVPLHAVSSWMASTEGHREAILSKKYTHIGTGCYQDPQTKVTYWVQLFAY